MKKSFFIDTKVVPDFSAAVIAAGVANPFDHIKSVESHLRKKNVQGKVVFDLLLSNGTRSNRYFWAFFDGAHFNVADIHKLTPESSVLNEYSAAVMKDHFEDIDSVLLTNAMRFAIKRGTPL